MKLNELGAVEAADRIANGEITSEQLVQSCLDRIAERDPEVLAWIHLDPELALEQARIRDAERARGHGTGPLHGVAGGIKDILSCREIVDQTMREAHEVIGRLTPFAD